MRDAGVREEIQHGQQVAHAIIRGTGTYAPQALEGREGKEGIHNAGGRIGNKEGAAIGWMGEIEASGLGPVQMRLVNELLA